MDNIPAPSLAHSTTQHITGGYVAVVMVRVAVVLVVVVVVVLVVRARRSPQLFPVRLPELNSKADYCN